MSSKSRPSSPGPMGKSLTSLSNELLLLIFQPLDNEDTTSASCCCRRFRALLVPAVFRSIRWPASQQEFPPRNLWPYISFLKLSENELEHYTADMRVAVASQIRDALPHMDRLRAFLLDKTIGGGMWPGLLDAFSALAAPCKLLINSGWYLSDDDMFVLPPRDTELRFSAFDYPFPFAYKEKEDCVTRRTMDLWQAEIYNVRGIIQATSKTMNTLQLPGELLRAMEGTTWTALTHLVLYGLWPTRANDTSDYTFVERRRPTPPSGLPESPSESGFSTTLEIVDDSVEAQDPPIHTTEEREPSVSNSAPQSSPAPEPTVMSPSVLHTPEIPPRPEESVSEPAAEIEGKEHSEFALLEDAPTAPARGPSPPAASLPASETFLGLDERVAERETLQRETTPVVETMTAPGLSSTAAPPVFEPVSSSGSPSEQPTDAVAPGPSTSNQPQNPPPSSPAIPNRSPLLVILESMPHLRVPTIQLLIQEEDEGPLGGLVCSSDERSIPISPTSFLRHLTRFEATCLAEDDRLVDYLPNTLVSLAIPRHPYMLEEGMARLELTPASVLSKLKNASFPHLRTLRLWYAIRNPTDLESEKELHDLLANKFPGIQHFELCRRWVHTSESLEGLWDPLPAICNLVYRFKALRTLRFDAHLPGLVGLVPFTYRNDDYYAMIGRLHVIASAIVNEAPWIKRVQMFSQFGLNQDLYWETWSVVPDGEGKVKLDRPAPIVDG
ncbi:F-box domain-containing protein [Mycena chlorophos]|uniref:F-box domain-containing protein n=1 Tax=Mycena chlorophos TaxID=658473 RepID=A0A8H6S8V7_MYCCL|nr:F-box domain-containing protein [Mycena chlorophos]